MKTKEIAGFYKIWFEKWERLYRWDLWAVMYIIDGCSSDDLFMDFRHGIVARGKNVYENALKDPKSIGYIKGCEYLCDEDIVNAAGEAYFESGGKMEDRFITDEVGENREYEEIEDDPDEEDFPDPAGEKWNVKDLPELYPKLWKKFRTHTFSSNS